MYKVKILFAITIVATLLFSSVIPAMAATTENIGIIVNNRSVVSNVTAVNLNGSIMIPAKELVNSLGGTFSYDVASMTGTVKQGENELVFRLDNNVAKFNGKYTQAPASMKIIGNRLMIPARFVVEKMGAEVYMNFAKNSLMIFLPTDGKIVYQVVKGDTLWIVSQLFGTSITSIKQLNNLTGDMLYIGQKLVIRGNAASYNLIPAVTKQNATIWISMDFQSRVVGYLKAGTSISITGKNGNWYKAVTPKGSGYLYYTTVSIRQDISDNTVNSSYFDKEIPVDTSKNYISYTNYTVQKGEYIWLIAEKFGIMDFELAAANNMSSSSTLYPGQVIKIPMHKIAAKNVLGPQYGEVLDWFKEGQYVFPIGKVAKFIDLETGKSFMAKRTMGANHSDTETLTSADTQTMKEIFGGQWTWNKRSFIIEVDGRRFAVSVAGMPHAGVDGVAYLQNVSNRSNDWGYGPNYDRIAGNGMNGHFDVYFLNCLRHVDGKVDPSHQYKVLISGGLQ